MSETIAALGRNSKHRSLLTGHKPQGDDLMTKIIQSAVLAIALIAGAASVNAAPTSFGNNLMHDTWIGR